MSDGYTTVEGARVGVLMGSASDWPTMKSTSETLTGLGIVHECNVISAHRAPRRLESYCTTAADRRLAALICAAGGAAHLAGVAAALTHVPVLACPMKAWSLEGLDSLLSMVQMPKGVPVACFAIGSPGAVNAALFAASILALSDESVRDRLLAFRQEQSSRIDELPGAVLRTLAVISSQKAAPVGGPGTVLSSAVCLDGEMCITGRSDQYQIRSDFAGAFASGVSPRLSSAW